MIETTMSLLFIDVITAVIIVNARKCDGDGRARRDTTCHAFSLARSLSLSRI